MALTRVGSAPAAASPRTGERLPQRRRLHLVHRLVEAVLAIGLYRVYAALRNEQGEGQPAERPTVRAQHHGFDVLSLEHNLHLNVEHVAQSVVLAAPEAVVRAANVYYSTVHLPLTALVFLWLLVCRPHRQFVLWRNVMLLGTTVALVGFAAFPTMPPRLLPGAGYVDTVATYGGLWSSQAPVLEHVEHPYAAMPSLHLVWALWVGMALWRQARWRWLRRLGPVHIAITAVVVLVTGNHWLLDVAAGGAVFAAAAAAVQWLRPRAAAPAVPQAEPLAEAA